MRSLIIVLLLFSTQAGAETKRVYSGIFCGSSSGIKNMLQVLKEPKSKVLLSDYGCKKLQKVSLSKVSPTFKKGKVNGHTYHIYRATLLDYNLTLYLYSDIPPKGSGWNI